VDASNNDITSQYSLSYPGTELKITRFAGKFVLVGSNVGNWNIIATKISDSSVIQLPVSVTPGSAANLTILDGNSQSGLINSNLTNPIRVKVTDTFGNAIANSPITFAVTAGSAKLNGSSTISVNTDGNGIASTMVTAGSIAERELISSTIVSIGKTVSFAEATTIPLDQASRIAITSLSSTATVGQSLSLSAQALDSTGTLSSTYTGSVTVSGYQNNGCTIPSTTPIQGTLTATASNGLVNFSNIKPQITESLYLKISAAGLPLICSQSISVLAPVTGVTSLKFTQLPTLLKTNQNFFPAIKVSEIDNNGQLMSSASDSISINSYDDANCSTLSAAQLTNNSAAAVGGYATFAKAQSSAAKTIYIKAVSGSLSSQCSSALVVVGHPVASVPTLVVFAEDHATSTGRPAVWTITGSTVVRTSYLSNLGWLHPAGLALSNGTIYTSWEMDDYSGAIGYAPLSSINNNAGVSPSTDNVTEIPGSSSYFYNDSSIYMNGGHIYLVGFDSATGNTAYWVDGVENIISDTSSAIAYTIIAVPTQSQSADVYVGGTDSNGSAVVWKNGVALTMPDSIGASGSIIQSGIDGSNNLYFLMSGGISDSYVYKLNPTSSAWTVTDLGPDSYYDGVNNYKTVNGFAVSSKGSFVVTGVNTDGDVATYGNTGGGSTYGNTGGLGTAVYWDNLGVEHYLSGPTGNDTYVYGYNVTFVGDDFYLLGSSNSGAGTAYLWKNGIGAPFATLPGFKAGHSFMQAF
jgi:hypothetical protein